MENNVKPNNGVCIHELFLPKEDPIWIKMHWKKVDRRNCK